MMLLTERERAETFQGQAVKLADALRDLLDKMETPRTTKASTAWDNALAALAEWDAQ